MLLEKLRREKLYETKKQKKKEKILSKTFEEDDFNLFLPVKDNLYFENIVICWDFRASLAFVVK